MRNFPTHSRHVLRTCTIGLVLLFSTATSASPPVSSLHQSDPSQEETIHIAIQSRSFQPASTPLHVGRITRLIFHNQDAELHAVVPVGLLTGLHLNIRGNGAPEFDAQGFKRVIIPSQGTAELRFIPARTGIFPYYCDMPGHQMSATFVVE